MSASCLRGGSNDDLADVSFEWLVDSEGDGVCDGSGSMVNLSREPQQPVQLSGWLWVTRLLVLVIARVV
jgi:hypothetical protein